ncbi:MAG: hypothetical protein C4332_08930 [Meiothermus sp.]
MGRCDGEYGGLTLPHSHPVEELLVCLEGSGEIMGTEVHAFEAGDIVIVPAGSVHNVSNTGRDRLWRWEEDQHS